MGLLQDRVALITGAGGGIGRAHALLFAKEGARVVVNDIGGDRSGQGRDTSLADAVVEDIKSAGGEAISHHGDISDEAGAEDAINAAISQFGRLDILVNNAGILRDKTIRKMTTQMFDDVIRVHLRGSFLCLRAAAKHMCERGEGGRIINTSSVSGLMGNFGQANYAAAKAGVYGLTVTAAMELKRYGVTVNALAPVALTRMTEDLPLMQHAGSQSDALSPAHIAPAALFLASDGAKDVTGTILAVEGARLYVYRMTKTPHVVHDVPGPWTAEGIRDRWQEITGGH